MPTKLKGMKIKRVAFVDEGANPDAHIRFAKSKETPDEPDVETEQGFLKRAIAAIVKALGIESVEKAARTFAETAEVRDYDLVMDREVYPMQWAMTDSVRSILTDTELEDSTKVAMLQQTLSEFSEAFTRAISSWAKAELANESISKDGEGAVPVLTKVRDHLNELIEKGAEEEPPIVQIEEPTPVPSDPVPDNGEETPVEKGATDMIFDTSKMTPEERATYEDMVKRFGSEETPATPPAAPEVTPPTTPAADEDVTKGLHPAVAAELESLRKFRTEQEDRQYLEVAKKYTLLGKKPEELAPILKSLKATGEEAYNSMIAMLDSNLAAVEQSGAFSEIGKRGSASTASDAWAKIESAAQEIVKSKQGMSWAQAVDAACCAHPELVEEYEKSRR